MSHWLKGYQHHKGLIQHNNCCIIRDRGCLCVEPSKVIIYSTASVSKALHSVKEQFFNTQWMKLSAVNNSCCCLLSPKFANFQVAFTKNVSQCVKSNSEGTSTDRVTYKVATVRQDFYWNVLLKHIQECIQVDPNRSGRRSLTSYQSQSHRLSWALPSCVRPSELLPVWRQTEAQRQVFIPDTEARLDTPTAVGWSAALCCLSGAFSLQIWLSHSEAPGQADTVQQVHSTFTNT